jgi:Tfp pilus assembly protein FimT
VEQTITIFSRQKAPIRGSGFTLLELVLVLVIVTAVLGMVAPSLSGFAEGRKPGEAALQFATCSHWARDQAVSEGATYQINIDADKRTWQIVHVDGNVQTPAEGEMGREYKADESVTVTALRPGGMPLTEIVFEPTGRVDVGEVRFAGSAGRQASVVCDSSLDNYRITEDQ